MSDGKILILDDDQTVLSVFASAFRAKGYKVVTCMDEESIVEMSAVFKPDFILLDLYLPKASGWDVCRDLKTNPDTHDIPVIFISGSVDHQDVIKSIHMGCIDFINKPLPVADLVDVITKHTIIQRIKEVYRPMRDEMRKFCEKYQ